VGITIGTQVLRGEPSGGGGSVTDITAADITDATSTGRDVLTGTAADGRDALGVTIDAMTGDGWTSLTPAAGESTTWSGGRLTLDVPEATSSNEHCGASRTDAIADVDSYDVLARVQIVSGDGNVNGRLHVRCGRDSTHHVLVSLAGTGSLTIGHPNVPSGYTEYVARGSDTIGSTDRTSGQLWLRVSRRPTGVSVMWGTGTAGALPTRWSTLYSGTGASYDALDLSSGSWCLIGANAGSGVSAGLTIDVLEIRIASGGLSL